MLPTEWRPTLPQSQTAREGKVMNGKSQDYGLCTYIHRALQDIAAEMTVASIFLVGGLDVVGSRWVGLNLSKYQ